MDRGPLVEMQIDDGAKIVEAIREGGFDAPAAWWMKASEEGEWFLYIASRVVDDRGIAAAYRLAHSLIRPLGTLWVEWSDVKLVSPENPVAKDVLAIVAKYNDRMATRYGGKRLGNVSIDGAYIYPSPVKA